MQLPPVCSAEYAAVFSYSTISSSHAASAGRISRHSGISIYAVVSLWHGWQRTVATVRSTTRMRPPRPIVYISAFTAPYLKAL